MSDRFLELKDSIAAELQRTGFNPSPDPPCDEPQIPDKLVKLETEAVQALCDDFQRFYNFLCDEITRCLMFEEVARARMNAARADAKKRAASDKRLNNDKLRDAWTDSDEDYLDATRDYLFFSQIHEAQEERRRKMSKSLDRLYRELLSRGNDPGQAPHHPNRAPMGAGGKDAFKPVLRAVAPEPARPVFVPVYAEHAPSFSEPDVRKDTKRSRPVKGDEDFFRGSRS